MDILEALDIANEIIRSLSEWPDDDWFSLSEEWDLNIWTDQRQGCRIPHAVIYPAEDGKTITGGKMFPVFIEFPPVVKGVWNG